MLGTNTVFSRRVASSKPNNASVISITGSAGALNGTLTDAATFRKTSDSDLFEEVWTLRLDGSLESGDCGSWVLDASSGDLYGHIIAGSPKSGLAYVVPALHIFDDIQKHTHFQKLLHTRRLGNADIQLELHFSNKLEEANTLEAKKPYNGHLLPVLLYQPDHLHPLYDFGKSYSHLHGYGEKTEYPRTPYASSLSSSMSIHRQYSSSSSGSSSTFSPRSAENLRTADSSRRLHTAEPQYAETYLDSTYDRELLDIYMRPPFSYALEGYNAKLNIRDQHTK
ncbi:peptide-N4-(N-acetyl-beta- glucosaminyl)asparagine amidase [Xylographa bjoerkii]|nr:peptide-N4-(N-acetyl-beta- glucosaminyl)asparagine amidase [Xylographa bjoerkii]